MEYTRFGKIYFFEKTLSNSDLEKFINGEIEGEYLRDDSIDSVDIIELTETDKFYLDIEFGQLLINEFLIDNRKSVKSFSPQESIVLLKEFEYIKELCYLGDIKNVFILLQYRETNNIFTIERKEKYLDMVRKHLEYK